MLTDMVQNASDDIMMEDLVLKFFTDQHYFRQNVVDHIRKIYSRKPLNLLNYAIQDRINMI